MLHDKTPVSLLADSAGRGDGALGYQGGTSGNVSVGPAISRVSQNIVVVDLFLPFRVDKKEELRTGCPILWEVNILVDTLYMKGTVK